MRASRLTRKSADFTLPMRVARAVAGEPIGVVPRVFVDLSIACCVLTTIAIATTHSARAQQGGATRTVAAARAQALRAS